MFSRSKLRCLILLLSVGMVTWIRAGEVVVGATRDEVIAVYGKPSSAMTVGNKEILGYAQKKVILEAGRVSRIEAVGSQAPLSVLPSRPLPAVNPRGPPRPPVDPPPPQTSPFIPNFLSPTTTSPQ